MATTLARNLRATMGTMAAGAYIRTLREQQKLTRLDVIRSLDRAFRLNEKQLFSIEEQGRSSNLKLVAAIVRVLKGSADDLFDLLTDHEATPADGKQRAMSWLSRSQHEDLKAFAATLSDEQAREAIALVQQLQSDPKKLARLLGFGAGLISGDNK